MADLRVNPGTLNNYYDDTRKGWFSNVSDGTIIYFAPGDYEFEVDTFVTLAEGKPDSRIKFLSKSPYQARILAKNANTGLGILWKNNGSHVDIIGFEVSSTPTRSQVGCRCGIANSGSNVGIIANWVHGFFTTDQANGGAGIDHANQCTDCDTIGNLVESLGSQEVSGIHGIYHAGQRGRILSNICRKIQRTGTTGDRSFGIHLWHYATNVVIANNLIHDSGNGIHIGAAPGEGTCDGCMVTNNILCDVANYPIWESPFTGTNNYSGNTVFRSGYPNNNPNGLAPDTIFNKCSS